MAKNWYPVIDYMLCEECGTCSDHCHGCGSMCPAGAITYVGDDTGWIPPAGHEKEPQSAGCCCNGSAGATKKNDGSCCCCGD